MDAAAVTIDHSQRNPPLLASENPGRLPYPSDINERQWSSIWPLLDQHAPFGRPRRYPVRDIVDAINYRWHTGCAWRMLPHDFPPWPTVYTHFRRWQRRGLLRKIREAVLQPPTASVRTPVPDGEASVANFTDTTSDSRDEI